MSGGVSTADTTPLWGSPPSRKLAPPITEVVYAQECRRKRPGAPSGTAGKASRAGSSITVGASDPLDDTPRKMRRLQALRNARFNQTGELMYRLLSACDILRISVTSLTAFHTVLYHYYLFSSLYSMTVIPVITPPQFISLSFIAKLSHAHVSGRTKSVMTVQKTWTELNHQFLSDRDL